MAFFNDLVRTVASVEGIDEMTVRGIGINIREKGYISKGGRGLSAAKMTVSDAANLIIGVNASTQSRTAGEVVGVYRNLRAGSHYNKHSAVRGKLGEILAAGNMFGDALEQLIALAMPTSTEADPLGRTMLRDIDFGEDIRGKNWISSNVDDKIKIEINFTKPDRVINVRIQDAWNDNLANQIDFEDYSYENITDRYDITVITHRTLRAAGVLLAI